MRAPHTEPARKDFAVFLAMDEITRMAKQLQQFARETDHRRPPESCGDYETCPRCALDRVLRIVFKEVPPL